MYNILLIEPNATLRANVALNLTTTGGYQVHAFPSFVNIPSFDVDFVMLPGKLLNELQLSSYSNISYVLTTAGQGTSLCLGSLLISQISLISVAEELRKLIEFGVS